MVLSVLSSRKSLAPTSRPKERQSPCSEPCPQQITPCMALPRAKSQYLSKALLASFAGLSRGWLLVYCRWLFFWGFRWCACVGHTILHSRNKDVGHKTGVIFVSHHESGLGRIHGRHGWGAKVLIGRLRFNLRKESRDGRYQMKLSLFRAFSPSLSVRSLGVSWSLVHLGAVA